MVKARVRTVASEERHGAPKHYEDDERSEVLECWFDYAMHAMNLAYLADEPTQRVLLSNEALLWVTAGVAAEVRRLAGLVSQ